MLFFHETWRARICQIFVQFLLTCKIVFRVGGAYAPKIKSGFPKSKSIVSRIPSNLLPKRFRVCRTIYRPQSHTQKDDSFWRALIHCLASSPLHRVIVKERGATKSDAGISLPATNTRVVASLLSFGKHICSCPTAGHSDEIFRLSRNPE
jgi:hypothetical protein